MSRLWFLQTDEYSKNFSELPLIYVPLEEFKIQGNQKRMLEIIGVDCSKLEPAEKFAMYDKVIVPDECFFADQNNTYFFTQEYRAIIDAVRNFALANISPVKSRKIYYSYSRYRYSRSIGEDKLEKYFASKGYEIIYHPEKLSLDEQLNMLIQCESFASTIGSCSHNLLFLRYNAQVILIPRTFYFNRWQAACDQVHKLRIYYVDASFSLFVGTGNFLSGGPFLFFVSSNLRKLFHDENPQPIVSVPDFKKYLRVSFGYSISRAVAYADNPNVYKYYSAIAPEYFSMLFNSSWLVKFRKWLKNFPAIRRLVNKMTNRIWN